MDRKGGVKMTNILFFDEETIPNISLPKDNWPKAPLKNATKPETIAKIEQEWIENPEKQIKKMSCDYRMNKIVSLQMFRVTNNFTSFVQSYGDEKQMLQTFWNEVQKTDLIVGFGISGFDIPTIVQRSSILQVEPTKDFTNLSPYSRSPVYDIQRVLSLTGKPEAGFNLNWWLQYYGLATKLGDGSQVYTWYREGEIDKIHEYCRQDVLATKLLFEKIIKYHPIPRNYDREQYQD